LWAADPAAPRNFCYRSQTLGAAMSDDNDKAYPGPGEVLEGKYEIERVLGVGAMGAVVRAFHKLRKAPVALKFMSPAIMNQPGAAKRFLNEGVAASQIDSDHVLKILDTCMLPSGVPYLVMEFLEGEDLKELLQREGSPGIEVARAVHFALQMLQGLQVAHEANIVHRDMKPANCFVITKNNEPDFIKIVDFGISKVRDPEGIELTRTNTALGTPLYMSPEQARRPKDVDPRSDIYAVAGILYELIAGHAPFVPDTGTFSELIVKLISEEPTSLEQTRQDLPTGFWAVVARGLAKTPENRLQSAVDMAEALAPYADERSEHVLRQITGRARRPRVSPSLPPPTMQQPPVQAAGAADTVLMEGAPVSSGVPAATAMEGTASSVVRSQPADASGGKGLLIWAGVAAAAIGGAVGVIAAVSGGETADGPAPDSNASAIQARASAPVPVDTASPSLTVQPSAEPSVVVVPVPVPVPVPITTAPPRTNQVRPATTTTRTKSLGGIGIED